MIVTLQQSYWKLLLAILFALSSSSAQAQDLNPLSVQTIDQLVTLILKAIITIGVPILMFFVVLTGFYFVTAQGNPGKLEDAQRMLRWTIIGGAVILGAKVLYEVLKNTLSQLHV